jgi:L-threonylcarbamoyladenylate synthase
MFHTKILVLDGSKEDTFKIEEAGRVIKEGGLVAFPTETVYGLGANALDSNAIKRIFKAKGRPSDNPLIVHIHSIDQVYALTNCVSEEILKVMGIFWPGPITFVLPKSDLIPKEVTAGLSTVGIRMPDHEIALSLLKAAGVPIAAPSANTSGRPSPTAAKHVIEDLMGKVDIIIDGGTSKVGLESTVIDLTLPKPAILRPGGITPGQLETVLGEVHFLSAFENFEKHSMMPKSPGMKYTHYAPKAELVLVTGSEGDLQNKIQKLALDYTLNGIAVGIMGTDKNMHYYSEYEAYSMGDVNQPESIAKNLFSILRKFDNTGVGVILAEGVSSEGLGLAIMNRLCKAAGYNIIKA